MIKLIDVLNLMDDFDVNGHPVPFSIKFFTKDGEEIFIELGTKCVGKKNNKVVFDKKPIKSKARINPNHFKNSTRNIYIPVSDQIRKCKIRLITEFNGQKVVY
jgi:hypothetical protein